ncbi:hypothetical protein GCM10022223_06310 [Kineosporia mesophila]|uniref:HipA N-terminal subdomain 1 domain-containing protein n=1 Tax=Kineosporia mesophila TaxID=566012 RepID=A0ABP6YY37_9ACTN|nr:HipA N-terminal domain-containing protein [Kineosporia mesophila]MCD5351012.1 HipA N-terminal domain-containing protein [Kineosporia mesophila]
MTSPAQLDVWLYGAHIATLTGETRSGLVHPTLAWTVESIRRWGPGSRVLSAKLPIGSKVVPALVRTYLDGLLPEGNARTNHAMAAGIAPDDTLGLISAYGRDTPGAAIFVERGHGDPTSAGHYEPLSLAEVAERLRSADKFSPARFDDVIESSTLPGMVPKSHCTGERLRTATPGTRARTARPPPGSSREAPLKTPMPATSSTPKSPAWRSHAISD